jgi:hypothetical protein
MSASSAYAPSRPGWLRDEDELPHSPPDVPLWCENYLSYAYSPEVEVGIYFHMCHRGDPQELWDEKFVVALPDDEYLVAKAFSPGYGTRGPRPCAVSFECDEPFVQWTKRFNGAARLVSGNELRSAPLADGLHVPVDLELRCRAMSPPYDFGGEKLDQSWGTGHYEQHHEVSGRLTFDGRTVALAGTGLRDHSWGPRDYAQIGSTIWIHGQFPDSGRSFMAVHVSGRPPREPFTYAVTSDRESVRAATASGVRTLTNRAAANEAYEIELSCAGERAAIRAEVLKSVDMAFIGPSEIGIGNHREPGVNHDYIESFTRFEWDGEVGYGATDVSIELTERRHPE